MVIKAGPKKTQKLKPFKVMSPPFEEDVKVDGFYPQMSMRIRCDRKHDSTYESVYNTGKQSGLARGRNGVRKGAPALRLRAWLCNWQVADTERVRS